MIKIERLITVFTENTYVVFDDSTLDAVVIDPGAFSKRDTAKLIEVIETNNLKIKYVMATHGHFDHIMVHDLVCGKYGAKFAMSPDDLVIDEQNMQFSDAIKFSCPKMRPIDLPLHEGDKIDVGIMHFEVIETPGHTPGGLSFYLPSEKIVFTGDTLFKGSIGRSDFPLSSYPKLMNSIIKKLMTLPMDTQVLSGHGDVTTLASERDTNPFITEVVNGDVDATI